MNKIYLSENDIMLFAGDSITHGGRNTSMDMNHIMGHGFQSLIASRLAVDNMERMPRFANKGVSGDTIAKVYSRWADIIKVKPTVINLLVGVNDTHAVGTFKPDIIQRKYFHILRGLLNDTFEVLPDVKFILCEPFYMDVRNQEKPFENIPHPLCEEKRVFGNAVVDEERIRCIKESISLIQKGLPDIVKEYNLIYVPFQDAFDKWAEKIPASYMIWDNVHPTMAGHQIMADRWFEIVSNSGVFTKK